MMINLDYRSGEEMKKFFREAVEAADLLHHRIQFRRTTWSVRDALAALPPQVAPVDGGFWEYSGDEITGMVTTLCPSQGHGGCVVMLGQANGGLIADLAGGSEEDVAWYAQELLGNAPPPPPPVPREGKVLMRYTFMNGDVPGSVTREIAAPRWEEVGANYPAELESGLVLASPEDFHGRIGILHGVPGSGKTTLLRTLAREWREKANFIYIVDPETFFTDPGYLLQVLLESDRGLGDLFDDGPPESLWTVVICEDAEEFIAPYAKAEVGQALSRLLNLGDGMLGQGLRVLFLFTTNVASTALLPAITRPGRCFLNAEIPAFSAPRATQWLRDHGCEYVIEGGKTLAELYEILRESDGQA